MFKFWLEYKIEIIRKDIIALIWFFYIADLKLKIIALYKFK